MPQFSAPQVLKRQSVAYFLLDFALFFLFKRSEQSFPGLLTTEPPQRPGCVSPYQRLVVVQRFNQRGDSSPVSAVPQRDTHVAQQPTSLRTLDGAALETLAKL